MNVFMEGHSIRERIFVNAQMNARLTPTIRPCIVGRMTKSDVGDRLNELMQAHPLYRARGGQTALAKKTGIPQPTINRILGKKSDPEMGTLSKLAVEFGVTTEWLATGREPKFMADVVLTDKAGNVTAVEMKTMSSSGEQLSTIEGVQAALAQIEENLRAAKEGSAPPEALPLYVRKTITAVFAAYHYGAKEEVFTSVTTLLNAQITASIKPPQRDEAVGKTKKSDKLKIADDALRDAESGFANRSGGTGGRKTAGERGPAKRRSH
jgi:DNA-binding phage protein